MCGIAGLARVAGLAPAAVEGARRMTRLLAHRGPDDEQVAVLGSPRPWVATGARRLAAARRA